MGHSILITLALVWFAGWALLVYGLTNTIASPSKPNPNIEWIIFRTFLLLGPPIGLLMFPLEAPVNALIDLQYDQVPKAFFRTLDVYPLLLLLGLGFGPCYLLGGLQAGLTGFVSASYYKRYNKLPLIVPLTMALGTGLLSSIFFVQFWDRGKIDSGELVVMK